MNLTNELIGEQYHNYPYPKPIDDMVEYLKDHGLLDDPAYLYNLIWPKTGYPKDEFTILCAGCGANQGAALAIQNPNAKVTGVDLSDTSLAHSEYLQNKHGIKNLELIKMDLHDVEKLGRKFDIVVSSGVLHHLPNPITGFRALGKVMKNDGSFICMLYAKYGRLGVYMIQRIAQLLGIKQNPDGIANVKKVLESVPEDHPINHLKKVFNDFKYDAGLVDLFLNPQDKAFSVPEILDLTKQVGLAFVNWQDNFQYHPHGLFAANTDIIIKIANLPEHEQWEIMELLTGQITKHIFIMSHPERNPAEYVTNFTLDNCEDFIPVWAPSVKVTKPLDQEPQTHAELMREAKTFNVMAPGVAALKHMDGQKTIQDCLDLANQEMGDKAPMPSLFYSLWKMGHVQLRLK